MAKDLIGGRCPEAGRERIGLFGIDELEVRANVGQEKAKTEGDVLQGLGLDASVQRVRGARDSGVDALSPAGVPGLKDLKIQACVQRGRTCIPKETMARWSRTLKDPMTLLSWSFNS